jgi:hypothetical protein
MFVLFAVVCVMMLFTSSESAALTDSSRSILDASRTKTPLANNPAAPNREPNTYLRSPPLSQELPLPSAADTSSLERKASTQDGSSLRGNSRSSADKSADAVLPLIKPHNEVFSAGSTDAFVQVQNEEDNSSLDGISSNENREGQQSGEEDGDGELTLNDDKTEDADHDRSGTPLKGPAQSADNKGSTPDDSGDADSESAAANEQGKESDNNDGSDTNTASINGMDESNDAPFASDGEDKGDSKTVYMDQKRDEGMAKDDKDESATGTSTDLESHSASAAAPINDPVDNTQEGDIYNSEKVTVIQRKSKGEDVVSSDIESTSGFANITSVISSEDIRSVESDAPSGENETATISDASPLGNELTDEPMNVTTRTDPSEMSIDGAELLVDEEGRNSSLAEITGSDAGEVSIDRNLETGTNETDTDEGDELNRADSEGIGAASEHAERPALDDREATSDLQTSNVENVTVVDETIEVKEGDNVVAAPATTDGASVEVTGPNESSADSIISSTQVESPPIAEVDNESPVSSERKVGDVDTNATEDEAEDGNGSPSIVEEVPARSDEEPHISVTNEKDNESLANAEHKPAVDKTSASNNGHERTDGNANEEKRSGVSGEAVATERRTLSEGNDAQSGDTERHEAASDLPTPDTENAASVDENVEGNEGSDATPSSTDVTSVEENELNESSIDSKRSAREESKPIVEVDTDISARDIGTKTAEDVVLDEAKNGNIEELGLPSPPEEKPQIPVAEQDEPGENTESDLVFDQGEASGQNPSALDNARERNHASDNVNDDQPKGDSGEAVAAER